MSRGIELRAVLLAASFVAVSSGLAGASGEDDPEYAIDGMFTYLTISADEAELDPYRGTTPGSSVVALAYDSLVNLRPDGSFVSGLAEEWSADAQSATFTLRSDVTCSDGTPLTATQVAAAINFNADPENGSPQYGRGTPTVPLTATGDDVTRIVDVSMDDEPFGFLLHTVGLLPIMCARGLADPDALASGSDGTGPFVLTDFVAGDNYTFTRRDDYAWGPDGATTSEPGTPATVVVRLITSESTRANLLLAGEANLAGVQGVDRQRLDAEGMARLEARVGGTGLTFNHLHDRPTADKLVRQALIHALDFGEVIPVSTGGEGVAATGMVPREPQPCPGDALAGQLPEFDVEAAEALLDEAGWVRADDGIRRKDGETLTIRLTYLPIASPFEAPTAELILDRWQAIGVDAQGDGATGAAFSELFQTSDFDVLLAAFSFSLPLRMVSLLSGPVPPDGTNFAGIDNERFVDLAAQASALAVPEACTYWIQAEQALYQDVDTVPISSRLETWYLSGAEAAGVGDMVPVPTSLRVLE